MIILILGAPGVGKTTLARKVLDVLDAPCRKRGVATLSENGNLREFLKYLGGGAAPRLALIEIGDASVGRSNLHELTVVARNPKTTILVTALPTKDGSLRVKHEPLSHRADVHAVVEAGIARPTVRIPKNRYGDLGTFPMETAADVILRAIKNHAVREHLDRKLEGIA